MAENYYTTFVLAVFTVLLPIAWLFSSFLQAKLGGWRDIALVYRGSKEIDGAVLDFQTAILGRGTGGYYGCVTVTANREGLGLRLSLPWLLFHPPLFLPWKDVSATRQRYWLGFEWITLTFSKVRDVPIEIRRSLVDRILATVGPAWKEPET